MPSANYIKHRGGLLLALAAGLLAYANALQGVFVFDDLNAIVANPRVHAWSAWWNAALGGGLRPLLNLSYTFSWLSGGGHPFAFHLFNLLLHLATTGLVYALASDFMRRHVTADDARRAAAWTALLFAVHPLHSEAVTYVCGRSTALMSLFYLAALSAYAKGTDPRHRLAALVLFAMAVLSKENALLFPLALLVWEWACRTPWRTVLKRQWPYWSLCLLATVALLLHPGYWSLMWDSVHVRDLHDSFPTQLDSSMVLLGRLAWPTALNFDPDWPQLSGLGSVLPQLALLAVGLLLAWRLRMTRPWFSLGLMWALVHLLLPNTFFPRADIANERQLYWADWALLFALAVEMDERLTGRAAVAAALALICTLAGTTLARNTVYHSEVALWEDSVAKSPNKARAWNNLGFAYQMAGRTQDAVRAYCATIRLNPEHVKAHNNLARLDGKCEQRT